MIKDRTLLGIIHSRATLDNHGMLMMQLSSPLLILIFIVIDPWKAWGAAPSGPGACHMPLVNNSFIFCQCREIRDVYSRAAATAGIDLCRNMRLTTRQVNSM